MEVSSPKPFNLMPAQTITASPVVGARANAGSTLNQAQVDSIVAQGFGAPSDWHGRKLLVIIPDATRTAPVGQLFKAVHQHISSQAESVDILTALGTHQPMSEEAICQRLDLTAAERKSTYSQVRFFNHEWDNPAALQNIGTIPAADISDLSNGLFSMDVAVEINRLVFAYDQIVIIGPVFPHEVVGFSGGNKYLFPGIGGPEILNFFHWLGAVVTNPMIIGNKWTPVRKVVDRAGSMVKLPKLCCCMVVDKAGLAGLYIGTPETAWDAASDLSRDLHILHKDHPFHTVLSCAPTMYDEIWTGGKCMYKLEPVVADGGELIIYAPHITEICIAHGKVLKEVGYHCRDYFLKQWDKFKHYPWGVLAHSAHVYGLGKYENGIETPRVRVTLATGLSEAECRQVNLGYRDWRTIDIESYANREDKGILLVRKAGEMLYHLKNQPTWAGGTAS